MVGRSELRGFYVMEYLPREFNSCMVSRHQGCFSCEMFQKAQVKSLLKLAVKLGVMAVALKCLVCVIFR